MKRHHKRKRLVLQLLLVGIIAGLILGILFVLQGKGNAPSLVTVGGTPTALRPTPVATLYDALPPVKQTFEAGLEQTRAAALKSPQPTSVVKPLTPAATPMPTATADIQRKAAGAGWIVEEFSPPFPAISHVVTSMWYEEVGDKRIIVYAGGLRDYPGVAPGASQGFVSIEVETLAGEELPGGGDYLTPTKAGPVRIIDARRERLILRSDKGVTFYFDVPARRFVSSLTESVPTATAQPTSR